MTDILKTNKQGVLTVGDADVSALAKEFGTPLFIMDEEHIVQNMRAYTKPMYEEYKGGGLVCYASKAFCTKEICRIAHREGLGLDVVSGGELYTALSAGMPADKICFHGNNKSAEELAMAFENGVGRIVADSEEELFILDAMAAEYENPPKVLLRVKPGIEAHTHEFIQTGQEDSKFGVSLASGDAVRLLSRNWEHLALAGVHCHIGSQIFEDVPFITAAELMVKLLDDVHKICGRYLPEINLGGGFGIRYTEADQPRPLQEAMRATISGIEKACEKYGVPYPFLMVEPGRSIVGDAGITVYTIGTVKKIPGIRTYVAVDGGMADNPRYIMYQAAYDAVLPLQPHAARTEKVTICGKCCESGDILIRDIFLPEVRRGDLLAVLSTGAYNYSMSSNYNRLARPAVVMASKGKARLCVRRESYEDLIKNDL